MLDTQYETLLKKIQEANPAKVWFGTRECSCPAREEETFTEDIRLADVLLAMGGKAVLSINQHDPSTLLIMSEAGTHPRAIWNLAHDSLAWHKENQPETIEFLIKLLVHASNSDTKTHLAHQD